MGLIAGAIEERGIRTVCLSTFEPIMERVRPPRWLSLPFPMGFPLGLPHEAGTQRRILRQALRMVEAPGPGPVRVAFEPERDPS